MLFLNGTGWKLLHAVPGVCVVVCIPVPCDHQLLHELDFLFRLLLFSASLVILFSLILSTGLTFCPTCKCLCWLQAVLAGAWAWESLSLCFGVVFLFFKWDFVVSIYFPLAATATMSLATMTTSCKLDFPPLYKICLMQA